MLMLSELPQLGQGWLYATTLPIIVPENTVVIYLVLIN